MRDNMDGVRVYVYVELNDKSLCVQINCHPNFYHNMWKGIVILHDEEARDREIEIHNMKLMMEKLKINMKIMMVMMDNIIQYEAHDEEIEYHNTC